MHGENYWMNGCAGYVMECLNEPDYDYWFFAGLSGDNFAQHHALNGRFYGDGVSGVLVNNGGGCRGFLNKAQELNPDFGLLDDVKKQYRMTGLLWNQHHEANDGLAEAYARAHSALLPDNLEVLGTRFNVTLEAPQDFEKRSGIVAVIRQCGACIDEVVRILKDHLQVGASS